MPIIYEYQYGAITAILLVHNHLPGMCVTAFGTVLSYFRWGLTLNPLPPCLWLVGMLILVEDWEYDHI